MNKSDKQLWYDIFYKVESLTSEQLTGLAAYITWLLEQRVAKATDSISELANELREQGKLK